MSNALSWSFGVTPHGAAAMTVTVKPPPAYTAGGILVMCAFGGAPSPVVAFPSAPAGWTPVSAAGAPFGVFTKTASASESSYSVTFSTACVAVVTVAAYPQATITSSLFSASSGGVTTYTPAFPSGVTGGQVVLMFAGSMDYGAIGPTCGLHTEKLPATWAAVIPPIGPSNDSVAGNYQATCTGLCEFTGPTSSPTVTSQENSAFYTGFLVLTIPVPANTLQVTATAGGGVLGITGSTGYQGVPTAGMALTVEALTGAASVAAILAGGATAASYSGGTSATPGMGITPAGAGSRIAGALMEWQPGTAYTPASNTTFSQNVYDTVNLASYGTFHSAGAPAQGTPVTYGATGPANTRVNIALAEILAAGGITVQSTATALGQAPSDFAAPAVQQTAIFPARPPAGSLLVATVSVNSNFLPGGTITMALADSGGLTWTALTESNTVTGAYAGVWVAQVPAAPPVTAAGGVFVTTPVLPTGQVGQAYSAALTALGGTGSYTWAVTGGALPSGLSLSSAGVVSGTPASAGTGTVTVTATDTAANTAAAALATTTITGPAGNPAGGPWALAFADEFNYPFPTPYGSGVNPNVWSDHLINGDMFRTNDDGEIQWYPHGYSGQAVSSSHLTLTAKAQNPQDIDPSCPSGDMIPGDSASNPGSFISGMLASYLSYNFTYGYVEIYMSHPGTTQPGTWPQFAMYTRDNYWPPEIDIDEFNPGNHPNQTHNGYDNESDVYQSGYFTPSSGFHTWGMALTPSHVTFYFDGAQSYQATYPGNAYAWFLIYTLAVQTGAGSGGFPYSMSIDYIRAWTMAGAPPVPAITSISTPSGLATSQTVNFTTVAGATSYRVTASPTDSMADHYGGSAVTASARYTASGSSSPLTVTGLPSGVRWNFTVCAINAAGYSAESQPAGPQVIEIQMVTAALPAASAGVPYSAALTAKAGFPPYTWSVTGGALPAWATLNASTGVISGTPSGAGTASFIVKVAGTGSWPGAATVANSATTALTLTTVVAGSAGGALLTGSGTLGGVPTVTLLGASAALSGTGILAGAGAGGAPPGSLPVLAGSGTMSSTVTVITAPFYATAVSALAGGQGTWTAPGSADGPPDGVFATWVSPVAVMSEAAQLGGTGTLSSGGLGSRISGAAALTGAGAFTGHGTSSSASTAPHGPSGTWNLVFDDEFTGTSLNTNNWTALQGASINSVTTSSSAVSVSGGYLRVGYTGAVNSSPASGYSGPSGGPQVVLGNCVEASINFPNGSNWSAWWTDGSSWPSNGECDIAEILGGSLTAFNYHNSSGANNGPAPSGSWYGSFHTYTLVRGSSTMSVYWDGVLERNVSRNDNGGAHAMIINMGSGSSGNTILVDWVRMWTPG